MFYFFFQKNERSRMSKLCKNGKYLCEYEDDEVKTLYDAFKRGARVSSKNMEQIMIHAGISTITIDPQYHISQRRKRSQKSELRVIKREHCLNFSLVDMSYLIYINVLGNRLCKFGDLNYPTFLDYKYRYLEVCYDYLSSQNEQDHYNFLD